MTINKRILFVTYGGGHVNLMIPVIQELSRYTGIDVHVLGLTTASHALTQANIPHFGFKELVRAGDDKALKKGVLLADALGKNTNSKVSYEETVAYLGLSYEDLERRHSVEDAKKIYSEKGRAAFLPETIMQRLFEELKPDVVVATNSPRTERAAILVADRLKIPSICVVDLFAAETWLWQKNYAKKVCVFSEYVKKLLLSKGRSPEEIEVTGNPAFDKLAHPELNQLASQLREQRAWRDDFVILWAGAEKQYSTKEQEERLELSLHLAIEEKLKTIVMKHKKWRLVIRPHPNEVMIDNHVSESVEPSSSSEELAPLLAAVDIVVVVLSTVGLEAMFLNKPLVHINCLLSHKVPFSVFGTQHAVDNIEDIEIVLMQAYRERQKPVYDLPKAGQAAVNVVNVIRDFVEK